ncbi:MAG: nitroreductase family protein [Pseudomonadota bacterium]
MSEHDITPQPPRTLSPDALLAWLLSRRSVRKFTDQPIERNTLVQLMQAATSAPSASNRQPWRFAVVTAPGLRRRIAEAVQQRADEMKALIQRGHHADDFGNYGDFFHEPLLSAAVIVVPQYREHPDLIAELLRSGGANAEQFHTASAMQAERCSTSAAVMNLLLQAHASGLGGCWMAGPMIARDEVSRLLKIAPPWHMLGAVALGHPVASTAPAQPRKPMERVVQWFDADEANSPA